MFDLFGFVGVSNFSCKEKYSQALSVAKEDETELKTVLYSNRFVESEKMCQEVFVV